MEARNVIGALVTLLLFLMAGCVQQERELHGSSGWLSYDEGIQEMKITEKPAILYFCSPDNDFCKLLEKELFSNKTVSERMQDFVTIKIDVSDPSQEEVLSKYRFENIPFPLVIFLDSEGNELSRLVAYSIYDPSAKEKSINRFIEILNQTLHGEIVGEDFRFVTLDGEEKRLSDYRGKVVILDLMSVNCPACQIGMEFLSGVKDYYSDDQDVVIISLDVAGDSVDAINSIFVDYVGEWEFGIDKYYEASSKYLLESAVPTIVIFDKYGRIFYLRAGVKTTQGLIDLIENVKGQ